MFNAVKLVETTKNGVPALTLNDFASSRYFHTAQQENGEYILGTFNK